MNFGSTFSGSINRGCLIFSAKNDQWNCFKVVNFISFVENLTMKRKNNKK